MTIAPSAAPRTASGLTPPAAATADHSAGSAPCTAGLTPPAVPAAASPSCSVVSLSSAASCTAGLTPPAVPAADHSADSALPAGFAVRTATMRDLAAIAALEAQCFPQAEAATQAQFAARLSHYANHFWLLFDANRLISFVDGFVTNFPNLTDEMYENAAMHDENGAWQMVFGVNTHPAYRRRGCAGLLLRRMIAAAQAQSRKGLVLTCKNRLISYYASFGFVDEGVTEESVHGGVVWNQMRLKF